MNNYNNNNNNRRVRRGRKQMKSSFNRNNNRTRGNRRDSTYFSDKSVSSIGRDRPMTIYTDYGRFAPNVMVANLIYQDTVGIRSPTGSSASLNWAYRSSAYDPDPSVLTGAIPGFAELSNLYSEYCVHKMKIELEVANSNTENLIIVAWPSNNIQNVNALSAADLAEYSGNFGSKSRILGTVSGNNVTRLNVTASGNQLVGHRFNTDLDYSSSTSTNPIQMYGINIGAYCPQSNITYGIIVKSRVIYTIELFKLRQLES